VPPKSLGGLPPEVKQRFVSHLAPRESCRLAQVSHEFRAHADDDLHWRDLFHADFGAVASPRDWKAAYRRDALKPLEAGAARAREEASQHLRDLRFSLGNMPSAVALGVRAFFTLNPDLGTMMAFGQGLMAPFQPLWDVLDWNKSWKHARSLEAMHRRLDVGDSQQARDAAALTTIRPEAAPASEQ
jgi:hypothetical protein